MAEGTARRCAFVDVGVVLTDADEAGTSDDAGGASLALVNGGEGTSMDPRGAAGGSVDVVVVVETAVCARG